LAPWRYVAGTLWRNIQVLYNARFGFNVVFLSNGCFYQTCFFKTLKTTLFGKKDQQEKNFAFLDFVHEYSFNFIT